MAADAIDELTDDEHEPEHPDDVEADDGEDVGLLVVVPDDDRGVDVVVRGTVKEVTDDGVKVALEVTCNGEKVLGMPKAVLRG